eukprot:scaffold26895_cov34-Phaeocystis_antarctica.AAC.3
MKPRSSPSLSPSSVRSLPTASLKLPRKDPNSKGAAWTLRAALSVGMVRSKRAHVARLERGDGPAHLEDPHEVLLRECAKLHLHSGQLARVVGGDEHLALLEVVRVESGAQDHLAGARRLPHVRTQPDARLARARGHVEDLAQRERRSTTP